MISPVVPFSTYTRCDSLPPTHTSLPSGVTAMPSMRAPTWNVARTVRVGTSIALTDMPVMFVVKARE